MSENGFFGEKFKDIVTAHGGEAETLSFEWGTPVDPNQVRKRLEQKDYKALTVEHVDTSTGIANPIDKIGDIARNYHALYIVDSVCGIGGMPLKVDEWNIDICLTGSQKALEAPPGLTLFSFGDEAWKAVEQRKSPVRSYYADLKKWLPVMDDPAKYFATPSVPLILALREALRIVHEEGLEKRWRRHGIIAEAVRRGVQSIGLGLFPAEGYRSNTLTVPQTPPTISEQNIRKLMGEKYKIVIAGGLGKIAGKTFRIGHMGAVNANDVVSTLAALEMSLTELGYKLNPGTAVGEAEKSLVLL